MESSLMNKIQSYGNSIQVDVRKGSLASFLIEMPGKNLPDDVKAEIFTEFYSVALSAFNQMDSTYFSKDVYNHLFNVGFLVLIFDCESGGAGVAFRTCTLMRHNQLNILYIEGTAIKAEYQARGIYQGLTKELVRGVDFVVSRTQNPVVVTALSKLFEVVYPITAEPDNGIKDIAKYVAGHLKMSNYECDYMIGRKVYGGILTGTLPTTGNGMDNVVLERINPADGDCLILVCPV
ncbi:MAG: hypothetical protein WA064_01770 [Candidatus Moraniibacteriota bacterium]